MEEMYHIDVIEYFIWDLETLRRTNGTSRIHTTETSWWRTTERSLDVSFETCLRRRGDALMKPHCYAPLRRRHNVPIRCRGDVPLRRVGDVPRRSRSMFHLRRNCDVTGRYRETSLRRHYDVLFPGRKLLESCKNKITKDENGSLI